jgi:hypothetical protein
MLLHTILIDVTRCRLGPPPETIEFAPEFKLTGRPTQVSIGIHLFAYSVVEGLFSVWQYEELVLPLAFDISWARVRAKW